MAKAARAGSPQASSAGSPINEKAAISRVTKMMAIPGKSGEELVIADFIKDELQNAGVPAAAIQHDSAHKKSHLGGQIGNLIVKLPGTVKGPRRLLMGHIDTVPLCVGSRPVRDGDLIRPKDPTTALGGDNRAGACVVLTTALEILKRKLPHPPLTLLWPVQEEVGLVGARHVGVSKLGKPKLSFNWDGGPPNMLVVGATGDVNIEVEVSGIASHAGAHPEDGVNAAAIASLAIADLTRDGWHGLIQKGRNSGTSNIGSVSGGEATNVVMPNVHVRAEARSHDPKFRQKIVDQFRKAFQKAAKELKNSAGKRGSVEFESSLKYESFKMGLDEPSVETAKSAMESLGMEPEYRISNGGLDANWMTANGIPTVTMGCGQQGIHTVDEKLNVEKFLQACRLAMKLATTV